jgi:hypothetical protein
VVGETWTPRENNRSWVSIASSADGRKLVALAIGDQIYTSTDYGVTWTAREANRNWQAVASSANGSNLVAVATGNGLVTSTDSGVTWTPRETSRSWRGVTSSTDGSKLVAVVFGGQIYTSTDYGMTWMPRESDRNWLSVASSALGDKLVALAFGGQVYTSTDYGVTWTPRESSRNWQTVASSADGSKLVATVSNGQIYTSTDYGATWMPRENNRNWRAVASSADGSKLVAVELGGQIYTSTDYGVTWAPRESTRNWYSVASSADGSNLAAGVVNGGQIYISACTDPAYCRRGGRKDDFALPNDPTVRSKRLNDARPTVVWKDFDDTTSNRFFGHTFSNLPANIVKAELIIRMKPHSDIPENDSLHLGLVDANPPGTWAWELNIRNIPGAGGTWSVGVNPTTTFTLDLGDLPTGVNILTKLATDRYLDLMVQDDTAIDWVQLCVWTCPRRPYFFGLAHSPLGQALLLMGANGEVIISNIGSSGDDGARIDLGEAEGWGFTIDTIDYAAPIGAFKQWTMRGTIDGLADQEAWTERHELIPDGATKATKVSLDAGGLGATMNELEVFNLGSLLYSNVTPTGELYSFITPGETNPAPMRLSAQWDALCVATPFPPPTPRPTKPAATALSIAWDKIVSYAVNPTRIFTYRTAIESKAANVGTSVLHDEALVALGKKTFRARGGARLEAASGYLTLANLGSNGQDGVTIGFGKVDSFDVGLDPIVDREGNPLQFIDAYLEATAIGSLNGVPDQSLGVTRFTQVGVGTYDIFANFTAIGSPTQHVQVFNQGALVADFPGHTGPVGTASAWMSRIGKLGGQTECFVCRWPGPTSFLISGDNGPTHVGDELRILAEGATGTINYKSALQMLTAGIPEITIVDAQAVPVRPATLGNISTRLLVGTGDRVMIAGFIVQGSAPKRVLIRAAGPSLTQFGLPDPLANPQLELHDTSNTIGMNDNWQTTQIGGVITSDQVAEIQTSGLAPGDPLEPAIIATLLPGSYTAIVQGVNGGTGLGTAEVYDLDPTGVSLLANISTRGVVLTGDNIMIGGFIVVTQPTRVIVRAIGPSLTQFGVPGALTDPFLELHDSNGATLESNDNWQTSAEAAELTAAGLAPTDPRESGIAATLPPGPYTAIVRGVDNSTGNALVEVYALP